ncbi:MAG: DoxX family protein [Archangium sp.]
MSTETTQPSKGLNIALWIVQVLLALAFGMAGLMKSTAPIEELAKQMVWPGAVPPALVRFIGVSELLGGIGLLLPSLTRIQPKLTALAAAGLVVVMILAAGFHVSRGEYGGLVPNFVMGGLAAFVAWGRFKKAPITPR